MNWNSEAYAYLIILFLSLFVGLFLFISLKKFKYIKCVILVTLVFFGILPISQLYYYHINPPDYICTNCGYQNLFKYKTEIQFKTKYKFVICKECKTKFGGYNEKNSIPQLIWK